MVCRLHLRERLQPRLRSPQDQRMNIMRAFIGVDRFQIHHMPNDMILIRDTVAAVHVAGVTRDLQRLAA